MSQRYLGGIITANPTAPTTASASGVWTLEQQFQNLSALTPATIQRSVRLRSSAGAYFSRTLGSNSTSQTRMTWSGWIKRGALSAAGRQSIFYSGNSGATGTFFEIEFNADGLRVYFDPTPTYYLVTTQVFRDPSAWYHIVVSVDTTQSTTASRVVIYVNGVQVTALTTAAYPTQNYAVNNVASTVMTMGNLSALYFDGYLAEINFVDGQALTPSSFGAFDSNGVWQPLSYRGTYGTNGFYLTFADNSAATATTLGKDYSGNGNNFTPVNISVTAGVTYDSMLDVPTNSTDGTVYGRGNYATLNPVDKAGSGSTSDANLAYATSTSTFDPCRATISASTGKWYWEVNCVAQSGASGSTYVVGVCPPSTNLTSSFYAGIDATSYGYYAKTGEKITNGVGTAYGATYASPDVIGVALDLDAGTIAFYKNGTSQGTAFSGLSGAFSPVFGDAASAGATSIAANFGQRPFAYTPPTGFKALNTQNLPAVTINNGAQYMAATLWTGNSASRSISNGANNNIGTAFQPDLVWAKCRSVGYNNVLFDSVRGVNKALFSNVATAEISPSASGGVSSFNSDGFSLQIGTADWNQVNTNTATYVGWQWKAGGTAVTNTSGSITSSVSANTTAGFSVVTWTGTGGGAVQTFGHGLGVTPSMVITKCRSASSFGTDSWVVYVTGFSINDYIFLNTTGGKGSSGNYLPALPTSSVFSVGGTSANVNNESGLGYLAYCFASVKGYSAFGTYVGNGSADGTFVYTGFRPRFIMIKCTGGTTLNWRIHDSSRDPYNQTSHSLYPNLANAEAAADSINFDFLSNGFKLRSGDGESNGNGSTYIYAAFAENPFNVSRAR